MNDTTTSGTGPVRVRPIPECSPPPIDPEQLQVAETAPAWDQGMLAVEFHGADESWFGPQPTSSRDLPEPQQWAGHIAQALVEVMSGTRPAPQVIRFTAPEVYSAVARRSAVAGRRGVVSGRRAVVRRVLVCEPADGVAEACAVVVDHDRVRALAMRLTGLDHRWMVTALQVG
ncbi:Rv3235 family protein [Oryzihumus leptocrescens]|uniref:Uncharacterized protein n=1 Tax=Oryzihumus leptocrescens TaxID=297536 RepID=A0A542ZGH1_9MICO|nr:Rv3235 family protein [Oryzihumus leptocrescens]TQL59443.1 hypothetical protein FB474_0797 [Oryzihumus leptocrescens]